MTITEKILAKHAGKDSVRPGELILADVDLSLANDITAPIAIEVLERHGLNKLVHSDRIVLVPDHFTPNKDIQSAEQCKKMRDFAYRYGIKHYYEVGNVGIEHALLPEEGLVKPGMLIIGADSHTCTYGALGAFSTGVGSTDVAFSWVTGKCWFKVPSTIKIVFKGKLGRYAGGKDLILFLIGKIGVDGALYKALEFTGEVIEKLPMDDRFTLCNMVIEAGAKSGIITAQEYLGASSENESASTTGVACANNSSRNKILRSLAAEYFIGESDPGCKYEDVLEFDVSKLEPQVAFPHLPSNTVNVSEAEKRNVTIDQVVIGSCTNGRISDLRIAAGFLKGKKVNPKTRVIVIPATQKIYLQALKEGLMEIFIQAGCVVSPPTCGPCLGGHMGILASGERALSTTNRNFVGRMGHPKSEVYLCNPAVAGASAVTGRITDPRKV